MTQNYTKVHTCSQ